MRTDEGVSIWRLRKTHHKAVSRVYGQTIQEYLTSLRKAANDQELEREKRTMVLTLPPGAFGFYSKVGSSFVALSREKAVGFIMEQPMVNLDGQALWLGYIAVAHGSRNRGVGSALLSSAKEWGARWSVGCMFATPTPTTRRQGPFSASLDSRSESG